MGVGSKSDNLSLSRLYVHQQLLLLLLQLHFMYSTQMSCRVVWSYTIIPSTPCTTYPVCGAASGRKVRVYAALRLLCVHHH